MKSILKKISLLQIIRFVLTCIQVFPPCRWLRDIVGDKKQRLVDNLLNEVAQNSGLFDKYVTVDLRSLNPIGNRVWMFWYTGLETAPPIVKKCVSIVSNLSDVDLIVIDKTNLEDYFIFEGNIKKYFEDGKISIQTFSDMLRCQLLSRYGGFWFDATLFVTRDDFILTHQDLSFFSIHHAQNDLLLKQKWNEYFTEGRWSIYCMGAGKNNPLLSFVYSMYIEYYNRFPKCFDYFQTDYIIFYAYRNFEWVKLMIDSVCPSVTCSYFLSKNMFNVFDQGRWDNMISANEFQKLQWKMKGKISKKETFYDHFMNL